MRKNDLKFVQFQPAKDLLDINFLSMTDRQRGVYWSIKLYLYCNNGRCPLDYDKLKVITNCAEVEKVFAQIKNNFVIKNSQVQHKDVNADLRMAKKFIQDKRRAGLASAKARAAALEQCSSTEPTKERKGNVNVKESKVNNTNSNSTIETVNNSQADKPGTDANDNLELDIKNSVSVSDSLRVREQKFVLLTHELFKPRTRSDKTCLRNTAAFVRYQAGKTGNDDLFNTAFALAQESKRSADKPMAMFMSLMKSELGYRKGITKAVNRV